MFKRLLSSCETDAGVVLIGSTLQQVVLTG